MFPLDTGMLNCVNIVLLHTAYIVTMMPFPPVLFQGLPVNHSESGIHGMIECLVQQPGSFYEESHAGIWLRHLTVWNVVGHRIKSVPAVGPRDTAGSAVATGPWRGHSTVPGTTTT